MSHSIRIGARRSPLAVAQAQWVARRLEELGHPCEMVGTDSLGDVDRRRLTEIGGTGIFATAVRDMLTSGRIDVAVHSLKDLPVAPAPGLVVAAIPQREDVRDVLVGRQMHQWRGGTTLGTGSPRRAVQLEALARGLGIQVNVVPIRGNVDTRLGLVREGQVDAILLAAAGLLRLGRLDAARVTTGVHEGQEVEVDGLEASLLGIDQMLPAAGQGALAVECRQDADPEVLAALAELDHAPTRAAVEAERCFLSTLEAGCLAPVGAHAEVGDDLTLRAVAAEQSSNSAELLAVQASGETTRASQIGADLARQILPRLTTAGTTAKAEETR